MTVTKELTPLFHPGWAVDYFQAFVAQDGALRGPRLTMDPAYVPRNAAWLAECCRWVYVRDPGEPFYANVPSPRAAYLKQPGWSVAPLIASPEAQAALVNFPINDADTGHILVFRGTDNDIDVKSDLTAPLIRWDGADPSLQYRGRVHEGFFASFRSLFSPDRPAANLDAVIAELCADRPIYVTGHSLGAAWATLFVNRSGLKANVTAVYTFGSPRVGDRDYVDSYAQRPAHPPIYRVVDRDDVVTALPPSFSGYEHFNPWVQLVNPPYPPGSGYFLPDNLADHAPINYVYRLLQ